jgi:recombination protein RecR
MLLFRGFLVGPVVPEFFSLFFLLKGRGTLPAFFTFVNSCLELGACAVAMEFLECCGMAKTLPKSVRRLIEELSRLPGIGPKSAQRLAIYLLHQPAGRLKDLGEAVLGLKDGIVFCETCWNIAESNPCAVCVDETRDSKTICVVEEVLDVVALEKTRDYNGVYHVLHGALSPIDGVGPDQLKIDALFERMQGDVDEVILATNPSLEGEATALYIQKGLRSFDVKVTRIARGLPVGGDLEYADEVTLSRAIEGRGEF